MVILGTYIKQNNFGGLLTHSLFYLDVNDINFGFKIVIDSLLFKDVLFTLDRIDGTFRLQLHFRLVEHD